jgi:hypothetical protein
MLESFCTLRINKCYLYDLEVVVDGWINGKSNNVLTLVDRGVKN